ncbi:uncharacterized protein LOC126895363 isoform X2 [Daktulosphaira vitifoliae]|uniref:uncharacterized protein LOC126895363 isoform X2 n=1 Tax=Daktulosphaira vitifoliae TaxID=58002 RepID=UPI0021AA067E|nr:uncharacterized protein LOC126895363 isoform X2 [Daktulosphaira vitifoliae]
MLTSFLVLLFFCAVSEISSTSTSNDVVILEYLLDEETVRNTDEYFLDKEIVWNTDVAKREMVLTNHLLEQLSIEERRNAIYFMINETQRSFEDISKWFFPLVYTDEHITDMIIQEQKNREYLHEYFRRINSKPNILQDYNYHFKTTLYAQFHNRGQLLENIFENIKLEIILRYLAKIQPVIIEDDIPNCKIDK